MPFVNVEAMRIQKKHQQEGEKRAKKMMEAQDRRIIKARRQPLGRKPIQFSLPPPPPEPEEEHEPFEFEGEYKDIKEKINEKILEILALPAKHKRQEFQQKLASSSFMKKYIRNKSEFGIFDGYINENIIFAALYFIYYEETMCSKINFLPNNINVPNQLSNSTINITGGSGSNQSVTLPNGG
jgi:hypothetical protein